MLACGYSHTGQGQSKISCYILASNVKICRIQITKNDIGSRFYFTRWSKVSKSLGNVILPSELIKKFGVDGVRYFFLRHGPLANDIDITLDKIQNVYNSDLANGLGNLVSRVAKLC